MDNKNKTLGIITLVALILISVLGFFHMARYHSAELGPTNAKVPTEVALPPTQNEVKV